MYVLEAAKFYFIYISRFGGVILVVFVSLRSPPLGLLFLICFLPSFMIAIIV